MLKRFATLEEALSEFDASGVPFFNMAGNYEDEEITVFTQDDFIAVCNDFFSDRKFYMADNETAAIDAFKIMFSSWRDRVSYDYIRAFYALLLAYNPIENYNSVEDRALTHGKIITTEYDNEIANKNNQTESLVETPDEYEKTTKTEIFGYNSATASPSDIVTENETGTRTRERSYSGNADTVSKSGSDTVSNSGIDSEHNTKSGNIGVMTSQTMINDELRLRLQDVKYKAIKNFIDAYTTY